MNRGVAAARDGGREHVEVLQVVRARVWVARIVGRNAVRAEVYAELRVHGEWGVECQFWFDGEMV